MLNSQIAVSCLSQLSAIYTSRCHSPLTADVPVHGRVAMRLHFHFESYLDNWQQVLFFSNYGAKPAATIYNSGSHRHRRFDAPCAPAHPISRRVILGSRPSYKSLASLPLYLCSIRPFSYHILVFYPYFAPGPWCCLVCLCIQFMCSRRSHLSGLRLFN